MRKLGIIGGMSWVSTGMYYDRINRIVHDLVAAFGGSITAEHGVGRLRMAELGRASCRARV